MSFLCVRIAGGQGGWLHAGHGADRLSNSVSSGTVCGTCGRDSRLAGVDSADEAQIVSQAAKISVREAQLIVHMDLVARVCSFAQYTPAAGVVQPPLLF